MLLIILLLLTLEFSSVGTCPIYCQCYSAADGYHVTCQNRRLYEIPLNLTRFLQTTNHQNLIVDLSSNFLSKIACEFLQISTIITLILTHNQLESLPACFSQSSIEYLRLDGNRLRFNQTTILSSSKLVHLDLSSNRLPSLPRTFFSHLRRLQRIILNDQANLFDANQDQWIRSLTTRNQLTIVICNANFHLPVCLFANLFQTRKLLAMELNRNLHCDCSFLQLPRDKIHFHYCQSEEQQGICNIQSSRFEQGQSLIHFQAEEEKYREICEQDYRICQNSNYQLTTKEKSWFLIKNSSTNQSIITSTSVRITSSKKDTITAGAIISFVLVLLIVTIVCLYVILSGHFFQIKNRPRKTDLMVRKKNQQDKPIEDNINMNSNLRSYHQPTDSSSNEESDPTFYSIANHHHHQSSSSMTEIEIASLTSITDSSLSNETVIISHRNKQSMY